jgi:hypothetical protein
MTAMLPVRKTSIPVSQVSDEAVKTAAMLALLTFNYRRRSQKRKIVSEGITIG